ncbi:uncharacterized protein CG5902-like [Anopheles aquasalis]|uniref:uncharacterized protein CG5902-like n=1 Tax=Anopheles aquasalis TaxID=42839 RepID=UPI00215AFF30|nr:uncharacterized protein CG5902-like [Anopheles aquasalis]
MKKRKLSSTKCKDSSGCVETSSPEKCPADASLPSEQSAINSMAEMCAYCFDVLGCKLYNRREPARPSFSNDPYPLFVTWTVTSSKRLRGCIGNFTAVPLHAGLCDCTKKSAFEDVRFPPITVDELHDLTVSVSILENFQKARGYLDWTVGVHGIAITFCNERGTRCSATFLPNVATEQGWDRTKTIDSLLRKGGYRARITPKVRNSIELTRYTSQKWHMSYEEYRQRTARD